MNDYRISYSTPNTDIETRTVTERNEAGARKAFKAIYKSLGQKAPDIFGIELSRKNTTATKAQERETLEAIRKMVEELGPDSYLSTAFDGCFEDAESNIENDFGDSYMRRYERMDEELTEAQKTIYQLRNDIKSLSAALENERAVSQSMEQRTLSADDMTDCKQLVKNLLDELREKVKAAENTILEYAERPESAAFVNAVKERKNLSGDISYYTALLERLEQRTSTQNAA